MDLTQTIIKSRQMEMLQKVSRQSLEHVSRLYFQQCGIHCFHDGLRIERVLLHVLRSIVQRHETFDIVFGDRFQIRMDHTIPAGKEFGFAECHIRNSCFICLHQIRRLVKKHKVHTVAAVREFGHKAAFTTLALQVEFCNNAFDLNMCSRSIDLPYGIKSAAVDIFIRIILQKIVYGAYAQLLFKGLGSFFPDTGQKLYASAIYVHLKRLFSHL